MKKLPIIVLSGALLAGLSVAYAQNAPTTKQVDSPANINEGSPATHTSGSESQNAAKKNDPGRVAGKLDCRFASMKSCQSATKSSNFQCVLNPNMGTTGAK